MTKVETGLATFDTNILVYSVDVRDARKHAVAKLVIGRFIDLGGVVPLQCLNEFYAAVKKKHLITALIAEEVVHDIRESMKIVAPTETDLLEAMTANQTHDVPFYDALIWATVRRAGCTTFITEDLQDGRVLGGVTFRNPFVPGFSLDEMLHT